MICGIYEIRNIESNRRYIGSSVDIPKRWREHKRLLTANKHHCDRLQKSWNKYGASKFIFSILFFCDRDVLVFYEQRLLDCIKEKYNLALFADSNNRGRKFKGFTEEAKRKMSILATGRKHTEETKLKMRMAKMGKKHKPCSEETKKKISMIKKFHRDACGEKCHFAKLKDADIPIIIGLHNSGIPAHKIGSMFNVSESCIRSAYLGHTWKYTAHQRCLAALQAWKK